MQCSWRFISVTKLLHLFASDLNTNPTVEVLYKTNAIVGEGPFFDEEQNQLLWVDINGRTVNFLNVESGENR